VTEWLECEYCGADVLESDADGAFWEGNTAICAHCGLESCVVLDDDETSAYPDTSLDPVNVGQPQCNGACGACHSWVAEGHQCRLCCSRVDPDLRAKARALIEAGKSAEEIEKEMAR
jgi:hypothetical protein